MQKIPATNHERLRVCFLTLVAREASTTTRDVLVTLSDKSGICWPLPGIVSNIEISEAAGVQVLYRKNGKFEVISCTIQRSIEELNNYGVFFRYEAGLPAGKILKPPTEIDIIDFDYGTTAPGRAYIPGC